MGRPKAINLEKDKEAILKIVKDCCGVIGLIAEKLHITRQTLATMRNENEWLADAIYDADEYGKDAAEGTLLRAIKTDWKAAAWFLQTKAKDRGYGRETKVNVEQAPKAQFILMLPNNNRNPHLNQSDSKRIDHNTN